MTQSAALLNLAHGLDFADLYARAGLVKLDSAFAAYLQTADGAASGPHRWHVHANPTGGQGCAQVGGHYDPYNVSANPNNAAQCANASAPVAVREATCEMGDLAGKWGSLALPATADGKLFFTDVALRLAGGPGSADVGGGAAVAPRRVRASASASSAPSTTSRTYIGGSPPPVKVHAAMPRLHKSSTTNAAVEGSSGWVKEENMRPKMSQAYWPSSPTSTSTSTTYSYEYYYY